MQIVAKGLKVSPSEIRRDQYVRYAVDNDVKGRLNKEHLLAIGGFTAAKNKHFPNPLSLDNEVKLLILDIETAPNFAAVWDIWDQNIGLNQITSEWHILAFCAKWLGNDEIIYMDQRDSKDIEDDRKMLKKLWDLLNEADVVVAHNGDKFDIRKINARFALNGIKPPSSYKTIDTKKLASRKFAFTSNKLEYLTDKLCKTHKKSKHGKFPGYELWKQCLVRNPEAFKEMEEYNKKDVLSLEELFLKLLPWDNSINFSLYNNIDDFRCSCGSELFHASGYHYSKTGKFQKVTCTSCGAEYRQTKNLLEKSKREKNLVGIKK